jgi:hypothetical protein
MSVQIDAMGPTTFSRILGVNESFPNTTSLAITTQLVKSSLAQLFTLASNNTLSTIYTWSNILTNLIKTSNPSNTNIRGSEIRLGGASTTVNMLGNTINVNDTFPTILTGFVDTGRIQAGYVTVPAGTSLITPPTSSAGGTLQLTGTLNGTVGINGSSASGFNIVSSVEQEVNWVFLY